MTGCPVLASSAVVQVWIPFIISIWFIYMPNFIHEGLCFMPNLQTPPFFLQPGNHIEVPFNNEVLIQMNLLKLNEVVEKRNFIPSQVHHITAIKNHISFDLINWNFRERILGVANQSWKVTSKRFNRIHTPCIIPWESRW